MGYCRRNQPGKKDYVQITFKQGDRFQKARKGAVAGVRRPMVKPPGLFTIGPGKTEGGGGKASCLKPRGFAKGGKKGERERNYNRSAGLKYGGPIVATEMN